MLTKRKQIAVFLLIICLLLTSCKTANSKPYDFDYIENYTKEAVPSEKYKLTNRETTNEKPAENISKYSSLERDLEFETKKRLF